MAYWRLRRPFSRLARWLLVAFAQQHDATVGMAITHTRPTLVGFCMLPANAGSATRTTTRRGPVQHGDQHACCGELAALIEVDSGLLRCRCWVDEEDMALMTAKAGAVSKYTAPLLRHPPVRQPLERRDRPLLPGVNFQLPRPAAVHFATRVPTRQECLPAQQTPRDALRQGLARRGSDHRPGHRRLGERAFPSSTAQRALPQRTDLICLTKRARP